MSFENKVVLVTGAGSGVGEATSIVFAENGANIALVDQNEETAKNTAEKCKKFGNKTLVVKADVSKDEDMKNAFEKTIKNFGKLDVLVNNAGIVRQDNLLSGTIMDTYDIVLNTNLRSVIFMTSLATPYLIKTKGCIVNISSMLSKITNKDVMYPVYSVSKAGVNCFTRVSALELAPSGVRVNAVCPGPIHTNIIENSKLACTYEDYSASTALKKCADPQEVAELIIYLACDKAKSITGSIYDIDNGISLL